MQENDQIDVHRFQSGSLKYEKSLYRGKKSTPNASLVHNDSANNLRYRTFDHRKIIFAKLKTILLRP